jgi:lipopolysaccharide export system protein LptA
MKSNIKCDYITYLRDDQAARVDPKDYTQVSLQA